MKLFSVRRIRETAKLLQFLELMKATFDYGGNTGQQSAGVRRHERNSLDPRKDDFLKLMMQSSSSFKRDARLDSYDLLRKDAIKKARSLNIPRSRFKASKGWAIRFMLRMGLVLWHRTTICQKLPKDFEQKLLNYLRYITKLRKTGNFLMGQMATADDMAIYLDMPPNYTEKKGVKEVLLKTTGCEKLHLTVMLAATADGREVPPLLILKRKTLPKSEAFPKDVIVRAQEKGWMTEELMLECMGSQA